MNEVVVGCQSLVVSDELLAVSVNGRSDCWIPAPRGYAHILEQQCFSSSTLSALTRAASLLILSCWRTQ
jgi:hypothetical protein